MHRLTVRLRQALPGITSFSLLGMLAFGPVGAGSDLKADAARQLEFGVQMALKGSWREAAFRFEKAVKADDQNASAFNDLAVARETLGDYESAREAYERALALAPDDEKIRANYDLFMSFYKGQRRSSGDS